MSRPYIVTGSVLLLVAVFLGMEARRLGYYSPIGPGAGFFPVWLCVLLALLSLSVIAGALRGRLTVGEAGFWPSREAGTRIAAVLGGLVFVVVTLDLLGFRAAMAAFGVWTMVALGSRAPLQIALVAVLGSFGSKALFVDLLGVALPAGRLGW